MTRPTDPPEPTGHEEDLEDGSTGRHRDGLADRLSLAAVARGGSRRTVVAAVAALALVLGLGGVTYAFVAARDGADVVATDAADAAAGEDPSTSADADREGTGGGDEDADVARDPQGKVRAAGPPLTRAPTAAEPDDGLGALARAAEGAAATKGRNRERTTSCSPASTTLSVATYNIYGAGSRFGPGYDLGRVAADIRAWGVDVAILQEVYRYGGEPARSDQPVQLAGALGMDWAFGFNWRKGPRTQYGTAVLSRYPIVDSTNTLLPRWGGTEQRGLLRATIDADGVLVDVFDTHLQHTPQAEALRVQQAQRIGQLIGARRAGTGYPAVLGGDFNSSPTGAVSAPLGAVLDDTWFAVGAGGGATHPAGNARARIDRLYHSADARPVSAAVRPSAASDHNGVTAVYEVSGSPDC